jgi:hypothetical protein
MTQAVETSPERIASARKTLIICSVWVAVAPFAIWFGKVNFDANPWAIIPGIIGIIGIVPFFFLWSCIDEYRDAKNGVQNF